MEKVDLEALDAMHAAANLPNTISILSATIRVHPNGPDICSADEHEYILAALHNAYPALAAELRALRERVASLYTAMRRVVVAAGGVAEDGVSDEFLLGAVDEVKALRQERDALQEDYRRLEKIRKDFMRRCERMKSLEGMSLDEIARRQLQREDSLRAEAARLREALEAIKGINYLAGYLPPHEPNAAKAIDIARHSGDAGEGGREGGVMRHARLAEELTKLATDHGHTMAVTDLLDAASIIHSVPVKTAELSRLRAELAAARGDSARLDAVQRENWTVHYCSMLSRWEVLTDHAHPAHRKTYTGKTARAAIDAARKRDPRVDPRPGDELEFVTPEWNKERMRVVGTGEDMVRYQQKQLAVANGKWSGSSCDLARWRDWMAGSRVIHAAD